MSFDSESSPPRSGRPDLFFPPPPPSPSFSHRNQSQSQKYPRRFSAGPRLSQPSYRPPPKHAKTPSFRSVSSASSASFADHHSNYAGLRKRVVFARCPEKSPKCERDDAVPGRNAGVKVDKSMNCKEKTVVTSHWVKFRWEMTIFAAVRAFC